MRYGIKKVFLLVVVFVFVGFSNIKAQAVYDTLYSYPDTTTFYNLTSIQVGDIVKFAVTFWPDSSWESYQVEKLILTAPTNIDTSGYSYIFISLGELPDDTILYSKQVFLRDIAIFPNSYTIELNDPVIINRHSKFYVTGGIFFVLSISQNLGYAVPGQFAYWFSLIQWIEYVPFYFNLKVVVKKNVTSVDDLALVPTEFQLHQNYPNPFNPVTTISWQSPESGWQTIKIYNSLGEEIETLVDEFKPAGVQEVQFINNNLPSGVYFCQLRAGEYVETKKMIMMK